MSNYGILNPVISKLKKILPKNKEFNSLEELEQTKLELYKNFNISYEHFNTIFKRYVNQKYYIELPKELRPLRELEEININPEPIIPDEYIELEKHFQYLKNIPQPEQRTKAWFDYRHERITASDTGTAIGYNPYEPLEFFLMKKCDPNFPFRDNDTVFHGKKFEPIATMIYEHIYNSKVYEFGALPSEKYAILGASPDGISSKYTLNNEFNPRLGVMLEIKCPVVRAISLDGKIAGDICPFYYYCQVQQQLLCCELDTCDFWQCKILEYKTRDEYLKDKRENTKHSNGIVYNKTSKPEFIEINNNLKKGLFLEFYPKVYTPEFDEDKIYYKGKYIMPKTLDMNTQQYDNWIVEQFENIKTNYPDIYEKYYFHRIIYWKLDISHNISINRDDEFLNSIIPVLERTWEDVKHYRKNPNEIALLHKIINRKKEYIKIPTNIIVHNNNVMNVNFLDKKCDISKYITKTRTKEPQFIEDVKADFIEDIKADFIDDVLPATKKPLKEDLPATKKPVKPKKIEVESDVEDYKTADFLDDVLPAVKKPIKKNHLPIKKDKIEEYKTVVKNPDYIKPKNNLKKPKKIIMGADFIDD